MRIPANKILQNPALLLELFILGNLSFLTFDVYIAHSIVEFALPETWIPVIFSAIAPLVLLAGLPAVYRHRQQAGLSYWLGMLVGIGSIAVGLLGLFYHLESQFFELFTLKSLVYTAPFAAPLAYTGLGFLLLLNRMVDPGTTEWKGWVIYFALGGFIGNFALALCDHAQNGFFHWGEWIPVFGAAFSIGFLLLILLTSVGRPYLKWCLWIMGLQFVVGLAGFGWHFASNWWGPMDNLIENFVYGAPVFAPLLFPNIALLAILGLWALMREKAHSHA